MPALRLAFALLLILLTGSIEYGRRTKIELAKLKNLMEVQIGERTKEIEEAQASHLLELQRFAEFGRLSANLLHDVTNPLTAVSLNLQQLNGQQSPAITQALKSLRLLERYVQSARKRLRSQSYETTFNVHKEVKQLLTVIRPLANKAGVGLEVSQKSPIELYGDPVRFNQIVSNLISNAIDAYAGTRIPLNKRRVVITIKDTGRYAQITVRDYGKGINAVQLPQIFEPFYTTKQGSARGLGIGLSIVKQSVRQDFKGTICVNSSPIYGTTFTVMLKMASEPDPKPKKLSLAITPAI